MSNYEWRMVMLTAVIAGITFLYAAFAALQWYELSSSNEISRDSLISVQRAFVFMNEWKIAKLIDHRTQRVAAIQFTSQWTNSGSTPTKVAYSQVNVQWRPDPLPEKFDFPNQLPSSGPDVPIVLGPKATMSAVALDVPIEQILRLQEGLEHVYFWGTATYWDVFKDTPKRITEFAKN